MEGPRRDPGRPGEPIDSPPSAVPEVEVFTFRVLQHTGGRRQLPWGSAELSLTFSAEGIEISGQLPGEHTVIPWSAVSRVSRGASEASPGGGSVTVIGIESPGRIMRFAVRSIHRDPIELRALSDRVAGWSAGPGASDPGDLAPPPPPPGPVATRPPPPPGPPPPDPRPQVWTDPPHRPTRFGPPGGPPPGGPPPYWSPAMQVPGRRRRNRRVGLLIAAVVCLASGIALAVVLSGSADPPKTAAPRAAPDQVLADRLMLTRSDLPAGWSVSTDGPGSGNSGKVAAGEARITRAFAHCMGIGESAAMVILGGGASDQSAEASSPLFVGPPSPDRPGFSLELQTAATIVHSHRDEQRDFAPFADPRYPQCAGIAFASETQLGADSASGRTGRPGAATVSAVDVPAPRGEQVSGLLVAFSVSDRSASVPVEVETISLGDDRTEANLQALAIGGQIPPGAIVSTLAAFAARVAGGGQSAET